MPSADIWFLCHWSKFLLLTSFFMSVQAKSEKNLQCWRKNYMSINEISIFGLIFFIFRYHWHNNFTSAIKSFNHLLNIFFDSWRVFFTSVASILCFFFHFFWSWHNIFTSAFIFAWCWHILFMSLQWFSLIFLYWHMFFMSVQRISQKACFFIPLT